MPTRNIMLIAGEASGDRMGRGRNWLHFLIISKIMSFLDLVEEIRHRPIEEQIELQEILRHDLIAARREEIYQNHLSTLEELQSGKLIFSSDVDELMNQLSDNSEE